MKTDLYFSHVFFKQVEKPNFALSLHGHQALIGFVHSFLKQVAFYFWVALCYSSPSENYNVF